MRRREEVINICPFLIGFGHASGTVSVFQVSGRLFMVDRREGKSSECNVGVELWCCALLSGAAGAGGVGLLDTTSRGARVFVVLVAPLAQVVVPSPLLLEDVCMGSDASASASASASAPGANSVERSKLNLNPDISLLACWWNGFYVIGDFARCLFLV